MANTTRVRALALPRLNISRLSARPLALAADWYAFFLAAAMGLAGAYIYLSSAHPLRPLFDDSYISLTFARNIAEHGKLSFDGQTWSTGATSPLHVTLLAMLLKAGVEPIFADVVLSAAGLVLLAAATYLLAWAIFHSRLAGLLAALAVSFTSYAAVDAGNGLETTLFLSLATLSIATYLLNRGTWGRLGTGVLLALTVLTRPEGAFLVPAVVIYRWIERGRGEPLAAYLRDAVLLGAPAAIALGAWEIYSLSVSDTLGGTATAKLKFFQEDNQPFRAKIGIAADNLGLFAGPLLPLIALAVAAPRRREYAIFALFWVPVIVFYAVLFPGGLLHYFYRYQHPVIPLIAVMAGGGAATLLNAAVSNNLAVKLLVVAALIVVVVPMWEQYDRWRGIYREASFETARDLETMARDLNTIIKPDQVLATHDIGAVGYFADYRIIDLVGLVNPKVIPYHKDREVAKYVEGVRPDYLLIFPEWDTDFLHIYAADHPEKYQLLKQYKGGIIRLSTYLLYRVIYDTPVRPAAPEPLPAAPAGQPPSQDEAPPPPPPQP